MAKYHVLCNIPGLEAEVGDTIELSDKQAKGLVRPGVLELIPADKPAAGKKAGGKKAGTEGGEGDGE